jgi:DNA-binding transcriptional MocR family regulator
VQEQMRAHREILAPKFAAMDRVLSRELGPWPGVANWIKPAGGYFVSLNTTPGIARRVVELAREAGVVLTPAGATYPKGVDPFDSNIRLAPSMPPLAEVEAATEVLAASVLLAAAEQAEKEVAR